MLKYIAYCRKSTDEKDKQVLSIEAQIAELKEFAKRENLIISEFITEAKTAKIPGREQFGEVLKKIEKGMANAILSWHPDRLARNSIDGGKIIYLLDTGKLLDLKFPSFWFESTPQGKFMLSIAFGQSKYYVDNLSENVKRGNRQKLRNGVWPSKAPYGYLNNSKTRGIDVDEEKSKVVKKAFQLFTDDNISFTAVSQFLFKFGIRREGEKPVKVGQVKNMLANKFYIGILKYAGEYYQGSHKTFISKKLFDDVQKQIEKTERPRQHGHNFAFTGLATCGECGAAITGEQHIKKYKNGNNQTFVYYRCTKKLKLCNQKYLPEPQVEEQLRQIVSDCGLHEGWKPYFDKWITEAETKDKLTTELEEKQIDGQIQEFEIKLNRLLDGYLDQVIEPEIYKQKKNELFDEKLKLEEKKSQISKNGTVWLEPMREFVNCALQAQKIARAKNNCHDLAIMAKKVGSNFFLMNRRLSADLDFAFMALATGGGVASAPPCESAISKMVTPERVEIIKKATKIVEEELKKTKAFQYLAILHGEKVTGVRNGKRDYGFQIEVRCWESTDAVVATPTELSWKILKLLSKRITQEIKGVVSVTYNIAHKPPSTIEAV
jgi:DNA invertase Pin-like site-specific DNA recombinase